MSDALAYASVHIYLKREKGAPSEHPCAGCGARADEWSYDHLDPEEKVDATRGLPYSVKLEHYQPLCRSCHRRLDQSLVCPNGHAKTPETTYVYRGYNLCRTCRTEYMREWRSS